MKVFNTLVNVSKSLLRTLIDDTRSSYQSYTKNSPASDKEVLPTIYNQVINDYNVQRAKKVFSDIEGTDLYKSIMYEVHYARPTNIPTYKEANEINTLYPLPQVLDAPFESVETRNVSRSSCTVWVLWMMDGSIEIVAPSPTRGRMLVGCDDLETNDPADPMPEEVARAVKVILGTELVDNSLRGCRWIHYNR